MEYLEILSSVFSGAVGGAALVSFIFKKIIDHRLNERLKVFDFVLQNRARACGEILGAMGKIISVSREMVHDDKFVRHHNEELSHATVDLEDYLRPAYILLNNSLYDQIHDYKRTAQSLLRLYFFLKNSDSHKDQIRDEMAAVVAALEYQRNTVMSNIGAIIEPLKK